LSGVLAALGYHPRVSCVGLGGLSEKEIGELIEALGEERSASLVARVHRRSGGNPFFATELIRAADATDVPGGVREALGNRLRRLSDGCNRLLGIASVIGSEFGLGVLEHVAADTPVLPLLDEARSSHLVAQVAGVVGGYRFAHALIREVLYTELPLEARSSLHWQIGMAIEGRGGAQEAGALAHHFSKAIGGCTERAVRRTCIQKAVLHATKAAEQATATHADEEAATRYEQALALLDGWAVQDRQQRCELLLALGEAQTRAGANYAVRSETFHRAAALARELGEPQLLTRAALGLAEWSLTLDAAAAIRVALLREALDAVGPQDSSVRARLLGSLALATYFPDPHVHSVQLSAEAVAIARRLGEPCMIALRSRYNVLSEPTQSAERMALATHSCPN
jgi:predicted ATPase